MQNIEFKAELRDIAAARAQARAIGAKLVGTMRQTDTYFQLPDGRLKRRSGPGEPVVWIYYHRPDRLSPRMSNYTLLDDDQARRRWGTHSLRRWLTVFKTRELWMFGNVRIHLDEVAELGTFLEFEAMVSRTYDVRSCHHTLGELRAVFAPILGEPISASYSDLMAARLEEAGAGAGE